MNETMTKIKTITATGTGGTVTFSNIPQGYTDLILKISARSDRPSIFNDYMNISFNGNTTGYTSRIMYGTGTSVASYTETSASAPRYLAELPASTATTSVFGSVEVSILNYTSSNYKNFHAEGVLEHSTSAAVLSLVTGYWSNNSSITSITIGLGVGTNFLANSTFTLYGIKNAQLSLNGFAKATGGLITYDGTYIYHTFLSTDTFVSNSRFLADILVVAGGGGGGTVLGGGGGAGGLQGFINQQLTAGTSYVCTIGAGGAGSSSNGTNGVNGGNSLFGSLTASVGGGGGGTQNSRPGSSGGSGGGGSWDSVGTAGAGTSGQGYAGGVAATDNVTYRNCGGGGGATSAGTSGVSNAYSGGEGGTGSSNYSTWGIATNTGENVSGIYYYAGGGAGVRNGGVPASGGLGGGGRSVSVSTVTPSAGLTNTGGGGAGGWDIAGGAGGSGVIIVRYKA